MVADSNKVDDEQINNANSSIPDDLSSGQSDSSSKTEVMAEGLAKQNASGSHDLLEEAPTEIGGLEIAQDSLFKKKSEQPQAIKTETLTPKIDNQLYLNFPNLKAILQLKKSKDIYLDACKNLGVAVPCSQFENNQKAKSLTLQFHGLGSQDALAILQDNLTLGKLDITGNGIFDGGNGIADLLATNVALTHLTLAYCQLSSTSISAIAKSLQENSTLVYLNLSGNKFNDLHASQMAASLKINNSVTALVLSHNEIGDVGALALGQGLASNRTIKSLNLSWNHIGASGIVAFCNTARENSSLTTLEINDNGLGAGCGTALSQYIARASNLSTLGLRHTRINDSVVQSICRVVDLKASLQSLDLSENPITDAGATSLIKTIQNLAWNKLSLKEVPLSDEVRAKLNDLSSSKPGIQLEM